MADYEVKDLSLAEQGELSVEWALRHMPVLESIRERFRKEEPLEGLRVTGCLHVTKETAALAKTLVAGGAEVALCGSNPLSTQDDVAASLARFGVRVYAWRGQTVEEYYDCMRHALELKPQVALDDGADMHTFLHVEKRELLADVLGGTEETTTGVKRLRAMAKDGDLRYPLVAVNDAKSKNLFDNPVGTGQSALDGVMRATNILIAGKHVVVAGFGQVGSGIAERARGMGATVTVVEADPFRALRAAMLGFDVASMREASKYGDVFITATGNIDVIRAEHFEEMKDYAVLANAGHFDVEVSKSDLDRLSEGKRRIKPCVDEYHLRNGRRLLLLGEGRLVNLACAEGHPSEVMDLSFSIQALSVEHIVKNRGRLPVAVLDVPGDIDEAVVRLKLKAMRIETEELTERQREYLASWRAGT